MKSCLVQMKGLLETFQRKALPFSLAVINRALKDLIIHESLVYHNYFLV